MPVHQTAHKSTKLASIGWGLLVFFAVTTGLQSLRYALPHVPFPAPLPNFAVRHRWLVAHAICASIALLAGPWQFSSKLRRRSLDWHRWMGRIYCIAVDTGWLASLPIAAHAQTGLMASSGFLILGVLWISTTAAGYVSIRRGSLRQHQRWMTRSYALTFAAVTLRFYLPLLLLNRVPYASAYPLVAWMCWIPNLVFAEWLLRRRRGMTPQPRPV